MLRLRKLVLFRVPAHRTHDILTNILQWKMLDSVFIQYDDDVECSMALIDGLKRHRTLRHLCIIVDTELSTRSAWRLLKREKIEELVEAWANRDWMSMFFIWRTRLHGTLRTSNIRAIHHGDGNVKVEEMSNVKFDEVILAFPQFYALFWQYLKSELFPQKYMPHY